MKDSRTYYLFLGILVFVVIVCSYVHTIFPVMDDDEYFVDENNVIHNTPCPYKGVPWFTKKQSKYEFIKNGDWEFCNECFSEDEISKLMMLHECNIELYIDNLLHKGASTEYIDSKLEEMKLE